MIIHAKSVQRTNAPQRQKDPSQATIRRRCAEIRANWDERTHRIRAGWTPQQADRFQQWFVPEYSVRDLLIDIEERE